MCVCVREEIMAVCRYIKDRRHSTRPSRARARRMGWQEDLEGVRNADASSVNTSSYADFIWYIHRLCV